MDRIHKVVELTTDAEQIVSIQPSEDWQSITLSFKELDGSNDSGKLYLGKDLMMVLFKEFLSMNDYIESQKW